MEALNLLQRNKTECFWKANGKDQEVVTSKTKTRIRTIIEEYIINK